jgi:hypothetical protein
MDRRPDRGSLNFVRGMLVGLILVTVVAIAVLIGPSQGTSLPNSHSNPAPSLSATRRLALLTSKAVFFIYEGEPNHAYQVMKEARSLAEKSVAIAQKALYTVIYFQGVIALRNGETDNCVGEEARASCRSLRPQSTPIRMARNWRSVTLPSTSTSFPTTLKFVGC